MHLVLDIRLLSFVNGLIAFVMFLCMLHVTIQRQTYPGFKLWTCAALANVAGFWLVSFRHFLTDAGTVILANCLLVLAAVLICRGLARFCDKPQMTWLDVAAMAASLGLFSYFTMVEPSVNARIVVISFVTGVLYLRAALLAMGPVARLVGQINLLLTGSLAMLSLWALTRIFISWFFDQRMVDFMSAGTYHGITFLVLIACNIMCMVGLISLNSRRLENDLSSAVQEIKSLQGMIPICANCKNIRDDQGYWQQVERYMEEHAGLEFTHGICPQCMKKLYPELGNDE